MKRREFLKVSGVGATALVSSVYLPSVFQERKIKIGLIGAGWYGMVISRAALKAGGVEIAAVCDVDSDHLNSSADDLEKLQGTRPKTFKYFHELLDQKNLEVIFIGTFRIGMRCSLSLPAKKVLIFIARSRCHTT